jgi:hypothetical protein
MPGISRRGANATLASAILAAGLLGSAIAATSAEKIKVGALRFTSHAASFVA